MPTTVNSHLAGNTYILTLNRPESHNALNQPMREELLTALGTAENIADCHALILTGSGRGFCAGADTREDVTATADQVMAQYTDIIHHLKHSRLITIAAVNGTAAGIGCALTTACDHAVMTPEAKLSLHFNKLGLIADGGLHWELVRALGYKRTLALLTQGGELSANECVTYGLINRVVPVERLLDQALHAAQTMTQDPLQAQLTKECLRHSQTHPFEDSFALEAELQLRAFQRHLERRQ